MADVTLTYKGNTILELDDSATKSIKTAGKYLEDDIGLNYVKSGGGSGYNILKGISPPSAAIGQDGDVYLQITEAFTLLDYIAVGSTAGPVIDTGDYFTSLDEYEVKVQYTATPNNNSWIFGAFEGYKQTVLGYTGGSVYAQVGASYAQFGFDTDAHVYKALSNQFVRDDIVQSATPNWQNTTTQQICVFYVFEGSYSNNCRFYYYKLWRHSVLTHHCVAAKRNSDNAIGLLDLITGDFLTNSGSGALTAGNEQDVVQVIINSFVKVNGAWQELVGSDVDDVTNSGIYTGIFPPPASLGSDGDYYYQRGNLQRSIQSLNPGSTILGSNTTAYGTEFTVTEPVTVTHLFARTRADQTGKLQLGTTSEILAEIENVSFNAEAWTEVLLSSPIQLTPGTNYVVKVIVATTPGNVAYVNSISDITVNNKFSYVRARYGTSWPGSSEANVYPLVGVVYSCSDGLYRIIKQFYKESGSWSEIT